MPTPAPTKTKPKAAPKARPNPMSKAKTVVQKPAGARKAVKKAPPTPSSTSLPEPFAYREQLPQKQAFSEALGQWYQTVARDLPWRQTKDAYAIWLSEIMLQQTQVVTVIPYYYRFLTQFPTISALAQAPEDTVLKAWEGLGYYSRARNLHRAAKQMVAQHGGQFPQQFDDVLALPGVGRSTAGAILTFAFGQAHPILDGNVKRVLARLFDIGEEINTSALQPELWALSEGLLAMAPNPWVHTQAMMELGATLCTPKAPQCLLCPVRPSCRAAAQGTQHERPVKAKAAPVPHFDIGAAVIWDAAHERILIQQRPKEGLLGGMWEFPGGKQEPGEPLTQTVIRELQEELGITVAVLDKITTVKHAYTHFKITLHAYHVQWQGDAIEPRLQQPFQWVLPEALPDFPFPKANHPVITAVLGGHRPVV